MRPLVVSLCAILALTLAAPVAHAADSMWWLCTGVMHADGKRYVAVNVLEHRAKDGGNRNLDVALIKGANIWRASVHGAKGTAVVDRRVPLHIKHGARTVFRGTLELTLKRKRLELRGKLDSGWGFGRAPRIKARAVLSCRHLDDLTLRP